MSDKYADGFDYFPAGASSTVVQQLMAAAGWYSPSTVPSLKQPGRFGFGGALGWNVFVQTLWGSRNVRVINGGVPMVTGFMGWGIYVGNDNRQNWQVGFYDAVTDAPQVTIVFEPNGVIAAYRGYFNSGTLLGKTRAGAYQVDEWFWLEAGVTIDATAGSIEVRVNTVPVIQVPSANTRNTGVTGFDSVMFEAFGTSAIGLQLHGRVDDLYVNDDSGAVNNSFLGNVRIETQLTFGSGPSTTFTPNGAATNWQAAQNLGLDDTKYDASPTVGDIDLYAMQPILPAQPVHFLQVRTGARQDDATQRVLHNVIKYGATQAEGADHFLNQTYTYYDDRWALNPDTGVGFTGTDVNGGFAGPKVAA